MGLPFDDPQFWFVTLLVALVALFAARRVRRSLAADAESPCASCPKVAAADGAGGDRKSRLRVVSLLALALLPRPGSAASVERAVAAMGTTLKVEVEIATDRTAALAVAEAMVREVEATEGRLSTWRDDSELARINRAPIGEWVETTAYGDLVGALRCWQETDGAFHPALGRLVAAWDLRGRGRVPTSEELRAARRGIDGLGFDDVNHPDRIRRTADVVLEEGGFGKGAAIDLALRIARDARERGEVGFARVDFGGQIGWENGLAPVVVDVAHPRDRSRPVLEITALGSRGSLASSGDGVRRFAAAGESFGHILDPRTGRPAPDFGAVSVVAHDALRADCLSTALFVMGPERGARWLVAQEFPYDAVFLIAEDDRLRALVSPSLGRRVRALDERVVIEEMSIE